MFLVHGTFEDLLLEYLYLNALSTCIAVLVIGGKIYVFDFIVTFSSVFIRHNTTNQIVTYSQIFDN